MMLTVFKYPLEATQDKTMRFPKGVTVLRVAMQGKQLCLWALIDEHERAFENFRVAVVRTGGMVSPQCKMHVGSCFDGHHMAHVFVGPAVRS